MLYTPKNATSLESASSLARSLVPRVSSPRGSSFLEQVLSLRVSATGREYRLEDLAEHSSLIIPRRINDCDNMDGVGTDSPQSAMGKVMMPSKMNSQRHPDRPPDPSIPV